MRRFNHFFSLMHGKGDFSLCEWMGNGRKTRRREMISRERKHSSQHSTAFTTRWSENNWLNRNLLRGGLSGPQVKGNSVTLTQLSFPCVKTIWGSWKIMWRAADWSSRTKEFDGVNLVKVRLEEIEFRGLVSQIWLYNDRQKYCFSRLKGVWFVHY